MIVYPNEWKKGKMPSSTSWGRRCTCSSTCCTLESTFRWERTTPLGSPVDPEVKMIVATSSSLSPRSPGTKGARANFGTTRATIAAKILSESRTCLGISSSRISVPLGVILNRSSTLAEVMTCVMPAWSIEALTIAWLAV